MKINKIKIENEADFREMIRDWQADGAPEYDGLVIDNITCIDGHWTAYAHDDKASYSLTDDGTGNIAINYLGSK